MLAQSFKTAEELGLDDAKHGALVKVLGMLERGEIPAQLFNMKAVGEPECGSPGCIFGWAKNFGFPRVALSSLYGNAGLTDLFLPTSSDCYVYSANRSQAAIALRNYLTTGDSKWDEAMS